MVFQLKKATIQCTCITHVKHTNCEILHKYIYMLLTNLNQKHMNNHIDNVDITDAFIYIDDEQPERPNHNGGDERESYITPHVLT